MKRFQSLKKNEDIQAVLKNQHRAFSKAIGIYIKKREGTLLSRYAISVPKKYGNAVQRNLMKRRIRSVIDDFEMIQGYDVFIIVKPTAGTYSYDEIKKHLIHCFNQLKILKGALHEN